MFTAYAQDSSFRLLAAAGVSVVENGYGWVTSQDFPKTSGGITNVVLGTALVVDGFMHREPYEKWLSDLASAGPITYLPHRRETVVDLERYATYPNLEVRRTDLPAELTLVSCETLTAVVTLPTSAVATLSKILGNRVTLDVEPIHDDWWTPAAPRELRAALRYPHDHGAGSAD